MSFFEPFASSQALIPIFEWNFIFMAASSISTMYYTLSILVSSKVKKHFIFFSFIFPIVSRKKGHDFKDKNSSKGPDFCDKNFEGLKE